MGLTLEEQIKNHLEYNHTVPFPQDYIEDLVPICIKSINAVNEDDLFREIALPEGVTVEDKQGVQSSTAFAYEIVAACHLFEWLDKKWF